MAQKLHSNEHTLNCKFTWKVLEESGELLTPQNTSTLLELWWSSCIQNVLHSIWNGCNCHLISAWCCAPVRCPNESYLRFSHVAYCRYGRWYERILHEIHSVVTGDYAILRDYAMLGDMNKIMDFLHFITVILWSYYMWENHSILERDEETFISFRTNVSIHFISIFKASFRFASPFPPKSATELRTHTFWMLVGERFFMPTHDEFSYDGSRALKGINPKNISRWISSQTMLFKK